MAEFAVKPPVANTMGQVWRPAIPRRGPWWPRILLLAADEAFGSAAAQVLRAAGYGVFLAPDRQAAQEMLDGPGPLDLLIIDIVMPGDVDGCNLARVARERRPDLSILYVSAFDLPSEKALGKILRKPLPLEVLTKETCSTLLEKSRTDASPVA